MSDDHAEYGNGYLVAGLHMPQGEYGCANVEIGLCPAGDHVILHGLDADEDMTVIDMGQAEALYVSAALRLAALRVIAKTAPVEDLAGIAGQIDQCQQALDELGGAAE